MEDETKDMRIKKIPREVKREFKISCARREIGMNDRIIELMRQDAAPPGQRVWRGYKD